MSARTIAIDARWMSSGAGTYAFNLLKRIKAYDPSLQVHALAVNTDRERLTPYCDRVSVIDARIYSVREQFAVASAVSDRCPLHATHYNAALLHRGPLLVTIPDVTPMLRAEYCATWKSRVYGRPMLRAVARRADHIFTVSRFSRDQLCRHLHISQDKVTVAHNGVGPEFARLDRGQARLHVREQVGVAGRFLLYVGNLRPHKNVSGLLRAFEILKGQHRDLQLLLIAQDVTSLPELRSLARQLRISDVVHFKQFVPQSLLIACYSAAEVVVLPSLQEGFGLPVVEAMACGTPVACSGVSSLPEIGGDAVQYFEPTNSEDMAFAIRRVLEDSALAEMLRRRGTIRAAAFTWEQSAATHVGVYRRFVN